MSQSGSSSPLISWRQAFAVYTQKPVIVMFFLGFAAGLPLLLVFSTLTAWLSDMHVSRSAIGFFGWVGITYSIKVFWAPIVDRLPLPWLGRVLGQRRSWILLAQLVIAMGLYGMSMIDPSQQLSVVAVCSVFIAFASATQDIAVDAFRIESAVVEHQGAMSASYIVGYRLALLAAGAGSLFVADVYNWAVAYQVMALLMGVGVLTVLLCQEPEHKRDELADQVESRLHKHLGRSKWGRLLAWFADAVVAPFVEFFQRNGSFALLILLFIALFRMSDITMGIMANPFYLDLGFTKSEIASITKVFGFFMTIAGSFIGGLLVVRYGLYRPLLLGATMVALTNLLFAKLALIGPDATWLALVISADNLSGGLSNAAFVAYLSSLTNRAYTATQYALFSSLMLLPGKFVSGFSGILVDQWDYPQFFVYAALLGIPAILLSLFLWRRSPVRQ